MHSTSRLLARPRFALPALACAALGCARGDAEVDKPTPPDMQALAALYDDPDGALTPQTLAELFETALGTFDSAVALNADDALRRAVRDGVDARRNPELEVKRFEASERQPLGSGEGYLVVTRICDGWGDVPVPDAANGNVRLTLGFTDEGVDPVAWGEVERCRYRSDEREVLLTGPGDASAGPVRLFFGRTLPFDDVETARVLFDFELAAEVDGELVPADFDVRIDELAQSFEVRVPTSGGNLIAVLVAERFAGVRAANGEFACDLTTRTCTAGSQAIPF